MNFHAPHHLPTGHYTFSGKFSPVSGGKNSVSGIHMEGLVSYLRRCFPTATAANVGHLIGAPASTVDKWLRGESKPSADYYCNLCVVFGPSLQVAGLHCAPDWLERAADHEEHTNIENEITRLQQAIEKL